MKTLYNTTISIEAVDSNLYDMIIEFLENNNILYNETNFEEYEIDERTEEEKYNDWLEEVNDDKKLGLI